MTLHARRLAAMITTLALGLCLLLAGSARAEAAAAPARSPIRTLVLYDAPPAGVDGNRLGKAYAIMLRNLLGHWDTAVELLPVTPVPATREIMPAPSSCNLRTL